MAKIKNPTAVNDYDEVPNSTIWVIPGVINSSVCLSLLVKNTKTKSNTSEERDKSQTLGAQEQDKTMIRIY